MRHWFVLAGGHLVMFLTGCMATNHVEQSRVVTTGINPCGAVTYTNQACRDERSWKGPWLGQPDGVRP